MQIRYYKVHTCNQQCYRVRAEEHYNGIFANRHEWELYSKDEWSMFSSWTYLGKCTNVHQIGETVRLHIDGVARIELI